MESENDKVGEPLPIQEKEVENSWKVYVLISVFKIKWKQYQIDKRAAPALTLTCGVCCAPAPDHLHFGGKFS